MTDYTGSHTPKEHRDLWQTPPEIFAALNAEFYFQLDAAASASNALCTKFITQDQNTLETPWSDLCVDCKQPLSTDECYICETCAEEMERFADEVCGTEFEVPDRIREEHDG